MIYIYYYIGFAVLVSLMYYFFNEKIWFKWIVESIRYPYIKHKVDKQFRYMLDSQKIKFYTDLAISDKWFKKYWFYRKLEKHILLKHISKIVE